MAKDELFRGAAGGFFRALGTIPVNRRIRDASALSEAQKVLDAGGIIGIFPEGSFNRTKETVMPFKPGAARMAARMKPQRMLSLKKTLPSPKATITRAPSSST